MDRSHVQPLLDFLTQHPHWLVIAVLLTALLESLALVGILVPGVLLIFLLGTLAGSGLLSLEVTLLAAAAGAILGDGISFYLGRIFHERLHGIWPFRRYPEMLARGETFFRSHGGKSVVIGRFIGPIRPVIPMVAGMFDMPARQFFAFNCISALGWAPVYVLPGFLVGASLTVDLELPRHFYLVLFSVVAVLLLVFYGFIHLHWQLQSDNRLAQWLRRKIQHSAATHGLWYRLSSPRSDHQDFPLASLMLLVTCLPLFILLTVSVLETRLIWEWNLATQSFFQSLRQPLLDPIFIVITLLGDAEAHSILFAILTIFFVIRGHYAAALHVAFAGAATGLSIHFLKEGLEVVRPQAVMLPPDSFAFPSGHAGGAAAFWGLLATFIAQEMQPKERWKIYGLLALPVVLVGLSRLYLGVHWLSDVLGGFLWGMVICALTRISYSPFNHRSLCWGRTGHAALATALLGLGVLVFLTYSDAAIGYAPPATS